MMPLDPDKRRRILASARLLKSDKVGERTAALEALLRLLPAGLSLADLLERALPPMIGPTEFHEWQSKASEAALRPDLSAKEHEFVRNLIFARYRPTEKQMAWLDDILGRERCAA